MQWTAGPNAGFTTGSPWLPVNADYEATNVEAELNDPQSMLRLYADLLDLRHRSPALASDNLQMHEASNEHALVFERSSRDGSDTVTIALNFSNESCELHGVSGHVVVTTKGDHPTGHSAGLQLRPHEGVILRSS
jgi:glycosidase